MNFNTNEIWKDIPEYEGLYQVSNLGRIKSLPKQWITGKNTLHKHDGKVLKLSKDKSGYLLTKLCKDKVQKTVKAHQLVAMVFLGHKPNKYELVIDHINDNPLDNRVDNLQIVTQRYNSCKTQGKYSSQYKGVYFDKRYNTWCARYKLNGKQKYIGSFKNEYDAHLAYQNTLNQYNLN